MFFYHWGNPGILYGNGVLKQLPNQLTFFLPPGKKLFILTGGHFPGTQAWSILETALRAAGISFVRETMRGEPSPDAVDELTGRARKNGVEAVAAIGGGSVIDAAKAVAAMLEHEGRVESYLEGVGTRTPEGRTKPLIAVPTTAGTGSEATSNAVLSRRGTDGFKKSLRHPAFVPALAVLDPNLALGSPHSLTLACGMDAFCQLLESFVSTGATPFTDMFAREGLSHFARGSGLLPENGKKAGGPDESELRGHLSLSAYCSGAALMNAGLGTVHGLAGPLGAVCDVPHGTACGLLLPPVFRRIVQRREELNPLVLKRLAYAGFLLKEPGRIPSDSAEAKGYADANADANVEFLLNQLELWGQSLPKLSTFGITEAALSHAVEMSGNKNSPVAFSGQERLEILKSVF